MSSHTSPCNGDISPRPSFKDLLIQHDRVAQKSRSYFRVGIIVALVPIVMEGTISSDWHTQFIVLACYFTSGILQLLFWKTGRPFDARFVALFSFVGDILDISFLFVLQLSSSGGILPLAAMAILPLLCSLQVRSAASIILLSLVISTTVVAIVEDPILHTILGWAGTLTVILLQFLLCGAAYLATRKNEESMRNLSMHLRLQEALLIDVMEEDDSQRKDFSEEIHDGPLQSALALRQDLLEFSALLDGNDMEHVIRIVNDIILSLRLITRSLHPLVLEHGSLNDAVKEAAQQACLRIGADLTINQVGGKIPFNRILFGVARELLSNVVRHSQAEHVIMTLTSTSNFVELDLIDNGTGFNQSLLRERLAAGHIGVASHSARVVVAGGSFEYLPENIGTHVRVRLPSSCAGGSAEQD